MKKLFKVCLMVACVAAVAVCAFKQLSFWACDLLFDPDDPFSCRVEHPLQLVRIDDDAEYLLVKYWWSKPIEAVTDSWDIKRNKVQFRIANSGSLYGTTYDGWFTLYKNGEQLDSAIFGVFSYTWAIDYGSLRFEPITQTELNRLLGKE
ncbi:MAG: hypothetical protein LBL83_11600 [Clostridiales bacterium]|jgi:hypothetical protein|nr:hypothetical protein [Clostridiales bacterium]